MPRRNWEAIAALKDRRTKIAVGLATDSELLACYEQGFPHLFATDGEDPGSRRIPLSVLLEASREYAREHSDMSKWEVDAHLNLRFAGSTFPEFDLPEILAWEEGDEGAGDDGTPPEEIREICIQLIGQVIKAGMTVVYQGRRCLVTDLYLPAFLGCEDEILGTTVTADDLDFKKSGPALFLLRLVDAELINLNA